MNFCSFWLNFQVYIQDVKIYRKTVMDLNLKDFNYNLKEYVSLIKIMLLNFPGGILFQQPSLKLSV